MAPGRDDGVVAALSSMERVVGTHTIARFVARRLQQLT